LSKCYV